jgi:hypothetical protein
MGEVNRFYKTVVEVSFENDKGQIKKHKEQYLVNGVSPTDAELKISKHLENDDFRVIQITETNIISVID